LVRERQGHGGRVLRLRRAVPAVERFHRASLRVHALRARRGHLPGRGFLSRRGPPQGDPAARARQREARRQLLAQPGGESLSELLGGQWQRVALIPIAFAGSLVFGLTGFGSALVTIPLATHFVPLQFALALFALADLSSALRIGFENPKNAVKAEWTRLLHIILVGTALGVTVLVKLPPAAGMFA